MTATNLMNGTQTKDALTLAQSLEDRGASLAFSANREGVSISGQGLSANLPLLVQTLADVVQNANFPPDQLELSRQRELTSLKVQLDDPRTLGRRVFQQAIYPENGYNGISRTDPRFYAALVLNQILGGDTLSSRLGTEVRDRLGLTYGIYSGFAAGINPGPFLISMQTAPSDAQKAIASTIALLKQLRSQGITEAELNTAKRSITNSYPVDLANPSEVASIILNNAVFGLSTTEIRDFPQRIQAVTMTQVQKAIEELIKPENLVIVTAGSVSSNTNGK